MHVQPERNNNKYSLSGIELFINIRQWSSLNWNFGQVQSLVFEALRNNYWVLPNSYIHNLESFDHFEDVRSFLFLISVSLFFIIQSSWQLSNCTTFSNFWKGWFKSNFKNNKVRYSVKEKPEELISFVLQSFGNAMTGKTGVIFLPNQTCCVTLLCY